MIDSLLSFLVLLLGFSFIIFVHELGHFAVAKWVGIKVTQFAIGFGPSIVAWRKGLGFRVGSTEAEYDRRIKAELAGEEPKGLDASLRDEMQVEKDAVSEKSQGMSAYSSDQVGRAIAALGLGETEYRLNYVPLGGYVKMLGQEDMDPMASSDDPRSYTSKPVWARMCVIGAGVIMNLIFAIIFFIIAFMVGVNFPPPAVGRVTPGYPAATTYADGHDADEAYLGLQPNDIITHIDDKPVLDFTELLLESALAGEGQQFRLTVKRQHHNQLPETLTYVMTPKFVSKHLPALGIAPRESLILGEPASGGALPDFLSHAGVKSKMVATQVNGQPVNQYDQFEKLIVDQQGEPAIVTFLDPQTQETVDVKVEADLILAASDEDAPNILGFVPAIMARRVLPGSPADVANMEAGDVLARAGSIQWPTARQLVQEVKQASEHRQDLTVDVWRDGQIVSLGLIKPKAGKIGIEISRPFDTNLVATTIPGSRASMLNLPAGSRIISMNGKHIDSFKQVVRLLAKGQFASETLRFECELKLKDRPAEARDIPFDHADVEAMARFQWIQPIVFQPDEITIKTENPSVAAKLGFRKTYQTMVQVYLTIVRMAQGLVPVKEIRGPVGIVQIGTAVAQHRGLTFFLFFLGVISVNLAVINFLPIPVVDGGHMVFLIIEKIKGSPVHPRVQTVATVAGLAAIGCFVLFVTYHDVLRFFTGE